MEDGPVRVLVHYTRVEGNSPRELFDATLRITKHTPLGQVLDWVWVTGDRFGYIDELHLWAHGIEAKGKGGFGVLFGKDGINLGNIHQWGGVAGWIDWIKLLACRVADNSGGNGMRLCSQLAAFSQAWVTASMDQQIYTHNVFHQVQMDDWEGTVFSWDPNGTQSSETYY